VEPTDHNLRAYDEMHRRRRALRPGLPQIVKATLGDLTSKRVLHLQSGAGDASADLAEQGAVVTAVDPSEAMLDAAREEWPKILWIQAEAQSLPGELRRGRFDLVYSPEGVIQRLTDPDAWAQGIASALQPRASCSCTTTIPSRSASMGFSIGTTTTSRKASGGSGES
jgi:2-polyprenyl-3-methyl-5-hydroxy-6-metoxy-1,4-benzoquinol methylase